MPLLAIAIPPVPDLLFASAVLVVAYTLFSLSGFGSALIAGAPLATVLPVSRVIPLLALLDCLGSVRRAWLSRHAIDLMQLRALLPAMLVGQLLGVQALSQLPQRGLALLMGGFVITYGLGKLLFARPPSPPRRHGALLAGLGGGVLGGLFGSGGFVYASYLEQRLPERQQFRATQAVLIGLSTAWRLLLCALGGLIDGQLLIIAFSLLPAAWLGDWLGKHIDLRLSRAQLTRLIHLLLVASGANLILRILH
ncbi:MAG: sulfite exporter TauE/SafE family protein [Rhodocyclales bacterium GT-UBC]|nr:MAG: sulfite exporter TauE/SafE family protein [Rhodocyclales bacterium GT-UBC]